MSVLARKKEQDRHDRLRRQDPPIGGQDRLRLAPLPFGKKQ